ncbi:MAG: MASE1 domain-containing protein, partial [Sphingomicrobium sp.]
MARYPGLPTPRDSLLLLLAGALIFVIAWGSIILTRGDGFIARVWLANAVLASILLRNPPRSWPALVAVGFAAFLGSHLMFGDGFVHSLSLASLKLAEVLIVAIPLQRYFGSRIDLGEIRPLGLFLLLGGLVAPLTSALGAAFYHSLANGAPEVELFGQWAVSHALGFVTLTPLLMAIPGRVAAGAIRPKILFESALLIGLIAGVAFFVYTRQAPLQSVIILVLVFAAFRLPTGAAALAIVVVAGEAVWLTGLGLGPIAASQLDPTVRLLLL